MGMRNVERHVFFKDANQFYKNESKRRKGSWDNFLNSGFRLMVMPIKMQMDKLSTACQVP